MLSAGNPAPQDIKLPNEAEIHFSLADFAGKYLILYFYPADDTPGCTTEACQFRDRSAELETLGAKVIGVSPDGVKSHQKFAGKHKLNFTLLADEEHKLAEAFGVWQEKSMFGKKFMGVVRSTFIIDPQGKIVKVWEKVNPLFHGNEVVNFVSQLTINN